MRFPIFLPARRDIVARNARREARIPPALRPYYRIRRAAIAAAVARVRREGATPETFVAFMRACGVAL